MRQNDPHPHPLMPPTKTVPIPTIDCPLCLKRYQVNPSMAWAPFQCLECGTWIKIPPRAGGTCEQVGAPRMPDRVADALLEQDVLPPAIDRPRRRADRWRDRAMAVLAAVWIASTVLVVVAGMLFVLVRNLPADPAPVDPGVVNLVAPAAPRAAEPTGDARQIAWTSVVRTQREVESNRREVDRLVVALRDATSTHFAGVQRDLEAARKRGRDLRAELDAWQAEYERASREVGR